MPRVTSRVALVILALVQGCYGAQSEKVTDTVAYVGTVEAGQVYVLKTKVPVSAVE